VIVSMGVAMSSDNLKPVNLRSRYAGNQ
jgi:hypothetical protein